MSLDGEVTLAELDGDHGITITNPDVTTVAGIVLAATPTWPSVGTTVNVDGQDVTVEEMRGRKITRVLIAPTAQRDQPPPGPE